jgi:hypothetical protein
VEEDDMNIDKLASLVLRLAFIVSLLLIGAGCLERFVNFFGYTIFPETRFSPTRMLEVATVFLFVIIALLLRQVRDAVKAAPR